MTEYSQNGYPVIDEAGTRLYTVGERQIRLARGASGYAVAAFARNFHRTVEPIDTGVYDDWGWNKRKIGNTGTWSNHASGTAIDLNATEHPQGVRGTFSDAQVKRIRELLDIFWCLRWGGDYKSTVDEMHFDVGVDRAGLLRWREEFL